MRTYELVFIVQPDVDEEGLNALVDRVRQVITDNGGEVTKVENMGRRRLAYPIERRKEGYYMLFNANLERATIVELERSLKLAENVLRYLLVRLDETEPQEAKAAE